MKNLIYQCWTGKIRSGCLASKQNMQEYAKRINSDYLFAENPNIASKTCDVPYYYEKLNPILDKKFKKYDNILCVDMDVFTVDNLQKNIFDEQISDIGICTEPLQPEIRAKLLGARIGKEKDEKWAKLVKEKWNVDMPRNENGLLKVYNTGMIVFSNKGLSKIKERFVPFQTYIDYIRSHELGHFYTIDQNYLHAMMFVMKLDYTEMDNGWNSYVHYTGDANKKPRPVNDSRNKDTKFVHIQLRGADDYDSDKLWRVVNKPEKEWML